MNLIEKQKVGVNEFVRRQIEGSGKTYSKSMTFEEIAEHAEKQLIRNAFAEGYRKGVVVVNADNSIIDNFICPFVLIKKNTRLISKLVKRQHNEEPFIQTRALNGSLLKTGKVELILYRYDVLKENNENTTNAEWELISINSIPEGIDKMPIGPVTMMRNQLNLSGGTKAFYSSNEWANSVKFYQRFAILDPNYEH
tara:strand:- start:249 stop:836 length:588 start_codon:yes stop_codon:yes gene_type:complete